MDCPLSDKTLCDIFFFISVGIYGETSIVTTQLKKYLERESSSISRLAYKEI